MYRNCITLLLILVTIYSSVAITTPLHGKFHLTDGGDQKTVDGSDLINYDEYDYAYEDEYTYSSVFTCLEGSEDVNLSVMCDGYYDCSDGSDEMPANCKEYGIDSYTRTTELVVAKGKELGTTPLVSALPVIKEVVDGGFNYEDACADGEFWCQSDPTICLPPSQVCDGIHDCPDKEDEENCTAIEWKENSLDSESNNPPLQIESPNGHEQNLLDTGRPDSEESIATIPTPIKFLTAPQIALPPAIFIPELEESNDKLNLESQYEYYDYLVLDGEGEILHKDLNYESIFPGSEREELTVNEENYAKPANEELDIDPITQNTENDIRTEVSSSYVIGNTQKKIAKHKRKVRHALGQLLQQIGELLKAESELDMEYDTAQTSSVELTINTRKREGKNDLYSRILGHRTSLTLNVGL